MQSVDSWAHAAQETGGLIATPEDIRRISHPASAPENMSHPARQLPAPGPQPGGPQPSALRLGWQHYLPSSGAALAEITPSGQQDTSGASPAPEQGIAQLPEHVSASPDIAAVRNDVARDSTTAADAQ